MFEIPNIVATDNAEAALRKQFEFVVRTMTVAGLASYVTYAGLFWWKGLNQLLAANVGVIAIYLLALSVLARGFSQLALVILITVTLGHAAFATHILGWHAGFHMFGFVIMTVIAIDPLLSTAFKVIAVTTLIVAYQIASLLEFNRVPNLPDMTVDFFRVLNSVSFAMLTVLIAYLYFNAVRRATHQLHALNNDLERLARTDGLTGLLNRREMQQLIENEIARHKRTNRPFSVILADIDHFKSINDRFGHQAGDQTLLQVVNAMREVTREQDQLARWGGEEFLILLPETTSDEAVAAARRLQARLQQPDETAPVASPTLTFGIAQYLPHLSVDGLVLTADKALYRGKDQGRNTIVVGD